MIYFFIFLHHFLKYSLYSSSRGGLTRCYVLYIFRRMHLRTTISVLEPR